MKPGKITPLKTPYTSCNECPVRELALFKGVPEERLAWTQEYRENQVLVPPKGDIFREGIAHDFVYTLFSGWAILYKTVSNNDKRQILRFLLPGDLIGYQAIAGNIPIQSASAITESVLCAFSRKRLNTMLHENPELALRLLTMESCDISLCQSHLMAAGRKTARESIAFVLLELYFRVQLQMSSCYSPTTNTVDLPITQEDIGDAVGLTNIHVNRVIKELTAEKLIRFQRRKLTIFKEDKLCEIADFNPALIKDHPLI